MAFIGATRWRRLALARRMATRTTTPSGTNAAASICGSPSSTSGERLVARLESDDFLHWKNSGLVLRSTLEEGRAHQTYCLPVFRYANVYLGYSMIYNVGTDRSVDCELAWSPDSITWQRLAPGTPLIPRGPKGSYDSACIYAMAGPPIVQGNDLLLFYGGDHGADTGWQTFLPAMPGAVAAGSLRGL